ncbi:MAG: hypothetical protein ACRDHP_01115 [Ktedonobacterales bacterium]
MAEQQRQRGAVLAPERSAPPEGLHPLAWWRAALLIMCAFAVLGAVPAVLSGDVLGAWHLGGFGSVLPPLAPTATPAPDLALPRQAWIAIEARVLPQPGAGASLALLEPGFPVTLTEHARSGEGSWSHIQWGGPSTNAGGSGWVPDGALVGYDSSAQALGDLGALAPALGSSVAAYQGRFAAALYFPDSGQLYRANADTSVTLGDAFRPILLAAAFAAAEGQHSAAPATGASSLVAQVATGSAVAPATLYEQLGDAHGLLGFLAAAGITGIQPAPLDWAAARGTPNALLQFYALLATGSLLTNADRASLLALLAHAITSSANSPLNAQALGSGFLLAASGGSSGSATLLASGIIASSGGPRYVAVVALTGQASPAAAQAAVTAFFERLTAVLG